MEAGNAGMWPQAQEAGSPEKLQETGTVSPGTSRGSMDLGLRAPALQKRKRTHVSCFTPPSLVVRYGRKLTGWNLPPVSIVAEPHLPLQRTTCLLVLAGFSDGTEGGKMQ